jgi:hypothetical protein
MTRVVIHIDRLVLKGIRREDRQRFAEGLGEELRGLLAEPGGYEDLMSRGGVSRLEVGTVRTDSQATPGQVGTLVAHSIARGITS